MDDPDSAKVSAKGLNPDKPEITNYKHHLILKLGQINPKLFIITETPGPDLTLNESGR
jgi:hypothetical protein